MTSIEFSKVHKSHCEWYRKDLVGGDTGCFPADRIPAHSVSMSTLFINNISPLVWQNIPYRPNCNFPGDIMGYFIPNRIDIHNTTLLYRNSAGNSTSQRENNTLPKIIQTKECSSCQSKRHRTQRQPTTSMLLHRRTCRPTARTAFVVIV